MRLVPGYRVWVAVRYSHSCAMAAVARPVGRGSSRMVNVPSPGSMSPLQVNAWRTRACASWFARAYPVWTRMARARAVAVLNAAMRIAWLISLVWMSRTCWPGLTWARGSLAGMARWAAWAVSRLDSAARRSAVSLSWSALVISRVTPGGGDTASSRAASVAARARSYLIGVIGPTT